MKGRLGLRERPTHAAGILGIEFGAPIFFIENVYRTRDGDAAAVSHLFLRADRYSYRARIPIDAASAAPDKNGRTEI